MIIVRAGGSLKLPHNPMNGEQPDVIQSLFIIIHLYTVCDSPGQHSGTRTLIPALLYATSCCYISRSAQTSLQRESRERRYSANANCNIGDCVSGPTRVFMMRVFIERHCNVVIVRARCHHRRRGRRRWRPRPPSDRPPRPSWPAPRRARPPACASSAPAHAPP